MAAYCQSSAHREAKAPNVWPCVKVASSGEAESREQKCSTKIIKGRELGGHAWAPSD